MNVKIFRLHFNSSTGSNTSTLIPNEFKFCWWMHSCKLFACNAGCSGSTAGKVARYCTTVIWARCRGKCARLAGCLFAGWRFRVSYGPAFLLLKSQSSRILTPSSIWDMAYILRKDTDKWIFRSTARDHAHACWPLHQRIQLRQWGNIAKSKVIDDEKHNFTFIFANH